MADLAPSSARTVSSIFWIGAGTAAAVGAFCALVDFAEFWKVAFGKGASAYPWGPVNENPWYYQTATVYAAYCLVSGLLYAAAALTIVGAFLTKRRRLAAIAVVAVGGCLEANLLSASIS